MREDPLPDMDPNEKFYVGDNQNRISGQALEFKQLNIHAWEAFEKGHDVHMQAAPSQAELLYKNYKVNKEKLKSQVKETIMEKYGNAASEEQLPRELLLGQSEREVEYDRAGRIIKGQEQALPKSKYEEDVYINNHTSVWGSWWKDHQWGYKCCKQFIRNSYCTGAAGIEAAEAAADLMKANIARKEATEDCSYMSWWSLWFMEMEIVRVFNNNELSGKIPSTLGLLQTLEILLKFFVPIAFLAFTVLVPVNYTNGSLEHSNLTYSSIDKFSISNIPTGSHSPNDADWRDHLKQLFGVPVVQCPERYLEANDLTSLQSPL